MTLQETYVELGETDAAVDAALERLQALYDDATGLGQALDYAATRASG